jgi:hypothetical protein
MELSGPIGKEQVLATAPSDASVIADSLGEPKRFAELFVPDEWAAYPERGMAGARVSEMIGQR